MGRLLLTVERVGGDHATGSHQLFQQIKRGLLLVGAAGDRDLSQHRFALMIEVGDQHRQQLVEGLRSPQRLPVDRHAAKLHRSRERFPEWFQSDWQRVLKGSEIESHEEVPQRAVLDGPPREPQKMPEISRLRVQPLGDRLVAVGPA